MHTKVAVSSVIDGGHKLVEVEMQFCVACNIILLTQHLHKIYNLGMVHTCSYVFFFEQAAISLF